MDGKHSEVDGLDNETLAWGKSYYGQKDVSPDGKEIYLNIYSHPESVLASDPNKPVTELKFCQPTEEELMKESSGELGRVLYWGYLEKGKSMFSMVYPNKVLFEICFPYDPDSEVDAGRGKIFRLAIEKEKPFFS